MMGDFQGPIFFSITDLFFDVKYCMWSLFNFHIYISWKRHSKTPGKAQDTLSAGLVTAWSALRSSGRGGCGQRLSCCTQDLTVEQKIGGWKCESAHVTKLIN